MTQRTGSVLVAGQDRARRGERQDDPAALTDHGAQRGLGDDQVSARVAVDRRRELIERPLRERLALHVLQPNRVQDHVDALGACDKAFGVGVDRRRVERVDDRDLYLAASRPSLLGHLSQTGPAPAG